MNERVCLRAWGALACFTRPENKVERVSYDVITPSAARGILEAVYWKPEIRWVIDRLHVLAPIRFTNIRRNEVNCKIPAGSVEKAMHAGRGQLALYVEDERQQRAATALRDVDYAIDAHFEVIGGADLPAKHYEMFKRRAQKGQMFHRAYLGCREFACEVEWLDSPPRSALAGTTAGDRELGYMLHDVDFTDGMVARFFHATMRDGVIDVPPLCTAEVRR
jgi:CRISPR-associated protein Cas5d